LIYLTRHRLMDESEKMVHAGAARGQDSVGRVCRQLISDEARYRFWLVRHDQRMNQVALSKTQPDQIIGLRSAALAQVHKTALVCYLRDYKITGRNRDLALAEFYGVIDTQQATIAAHQSYLLSASTGLCAEELLAMVSDTHGLRMIWDYREAYGQFFSMYCSRARAHRLGKRYLLSGFIPELKLKTTQIRKSLMTGQQLPGQVYAAGLKKAS
jgi:hypothetical protein